MSQIAAVLEPRSISEWILETAEGLRADLIIMGLHSSVEFGMTSFVMPSGPVLTVNCASGTRHIGPKASQITTPPLSDTDLIRIRGLGVKW